MIPQPDYLNYAAKMRHLVLSGVDMEVEARFLDMISGRGARILDVGCGIGTAVAALRGRGHAAYGIDPTPAVLDVAVELYEPSWFRPLGAVEIAPSQLVRQGLPGSYDVVLMSGNVPAFLSEAELEEVIGHVAELLDPGGTLVIGTTSAIRGGPGDQDQAAASAGLKLVQRYADWHLGPFDAGSPWSVAVFSAPGTPDPPQGPDGIFILRR
ncbi:MAG: class I SAM-dependent methyltransferase [Arthrobacter sp.]|uniref:class I SAM-dependent methyltransferase n=1 Tax=unclassified Arthrobacter TaxID=235627 RepID=UPI0026564FFB|nr:class I SAM-dependent methyltransferase [Micrococcaceae bacterium]MDN5812696.1 class I SAM-dependent methyltransferase [Micrococcaceae bacterium]MDN5823437.1 class I SAM-dependent methyltransferase [Micrococcaceae bacterium]MDN5878843.1 class I SAM-dependent methyltransferase [Micrococcaceae bacterium]MDN5886295.1 class I SAM-dependent methyltransferase [Micrococcaceae bacterium]